MFLRHGCIGAVYTILYHIGKKWKTCLSTCFQTLFAVFIYQIYNIAVSRNAYIVETSKKLLLDGKSITNTAFDMGFNSSTYFATVFRKFTQISPGQFIKENTNLA